MKRFIPITIRVIAALIFLAGAASGCSRPQVTVNGECFLDIECQKDCRINELCYCGDDFGCHKKILYDFEEDGDVEEFDGEPADFEINPELVEWPDFELPDYEFGDESQNMAVLLAFEARPESPQPVGTTINFFVYAVGKNEILYSYEIEYLGRLPLVLKTNFGDVGSVLQWTPTEPGEYVVRAYVKDSLSSLGYDDYKTIYYTIFDPSDGDFDKDNEIDDPDVDDGQCSVVCDRLSECGFIYYNGPFGNTVEHCVYNCSAWGDEFKNCVAAQYSCVALVNQCINGDNPDVDFDVDKIDYEFIDWDFDKNDFDDKIDYDFDYEYIEHGPDLRLVSECPMYVNANVGQEGYAQALVVNFGDAIGQIYSATFSYPNGYFRVLSPMPGAVSPTATYTITVAFKPLREGIFYDMLTINTVNGTYQCELNGTAYASPDEERDIDESFDLDKADDYEPSPNLVMVNECPLRIEAYVGQEGRAQGLIVNYGDAPGQIYSASFSSPNSYFSILSSLPGTVYPSATYTITVAFRPSSSGSFANTLIVNTVNGTTRCEIVGTAYNQPDGDEVDADDRVDFDEEPHVNTCYDACMRIQNCGIASYSECMNLCVNASQAQIDCVMATPCDSIIANCLNPADEDEAEPETPLCSNDVCSSAQYITFPAVNSSYVISGGTTSCSNDYSASCANARGPDAIYYFRIYQGTNVQITLESSSTTMNPVLSIYKDSCPGTEVACNDNYSSTTTNARISAYLSASGATTYFIVVDGRGAAGGSYTLTVRNLGGGADGDEIDLDEALPYYCAPACRKLQDCGLIGGSALPYATYDECLQGCANGDFGEAVAQCVVNTACNNLQSCAYADGDLEEEEATNPAVFELATQCPIYIYSYVGSGATAEVAVVNVGGDYGTISSAMVLNSTGVFTVTSPFPQSIWPGGSGSVTVMFKPAAAGSVSGTLMITTSSGRLTCQVNGMGYNLPDGDEAEQDKDEIETYADIRLSGSCPLYLKATSGSSTSGVIDVINYGTAMGMLYGVNFSMGTNVFYIENQIPADGVGLYPGVRYSLTVVFAPYRGGIYIDEMQVITSVGVLTCGVNGTGVDVADGDETEAEIEQDLPACNNDTCGVSNYFYLPGAGYSTSFTGTTTGCANDYSSGCSLSPGRDAVYNFHIYDTTKLTITLTSSDGSFTPVLFLRKQVCAGEEIACVQGSGAGTAKLTTVLEPTQYPTNYFIFVDGLGSGNYKLTVANEYVLADGDIEQDIESNDIPDIDDREPDADPEPEAEEESNDKCYAGCKRAVYECAIMSDYATCASWCDQGLFSQEQIECVNTAACPDMLAKCFGLTDGDEESPELDVDETDKPDVEEGEPDRDDPDPEPDKEPDAELEEEQQVEQCYIGCKRLVDECALMSDYAQCQNWCDQGLFSDSQIVCINTTPCQDMMAKCFGVTDGDEETAEEIELEEESAEEIDKDEAVEEIDKDEEAVEESPEEVDKDEDVIEEAAEEIDKDESLEPEPDPEPEMDEEAEAEAEEEEASSCPYNTCANAYFIPVNSGVFTDSGDTSSCSDFYQGSCNTNRAPEVVYRFYLPKPTRVVVDLAGSGYDTLLYMQRDSCPGSEVACNDDYSQKTSHLDVSLEPGDYYFFVDGYGTNSGAYKLSVNFEAAADSDNDSVPDAIDNCPYIYNPEQWDTDLEGIGDACDNCKYARNTDQADKDADGLGDVCDPTPDVKDACGLTKCSFVSQCTNYGLNLCQTTIDSAGANVCTKACSASDPCPAPWNCNNGFCACETPVSCPVVCGKSSQCSSDLPVCADVYGHDSIKECTTDCSTTGKCPNGYNCVNGNCICGSLEPETPAPPSCPWISSACYFNGTCTSAYPDYSDVVCSGSIWPPRAGYCTRTCMTNLDCIEVFGADAACNGGTCGCRK